ncbi:MAG: hypothetical protein ACPGQL_07705 [Thermoplasmatota archaeon]
MRSLLAVVMACLVALSFAPTLVEAGPVKTAYNNLPWKPCRESVDVAKHNTVKADSKCRIKVFVGHNLVCYGVLEYGDGRYGVQVGVDGGHKVLVLGCGPKF